MHSVMLRVQFGHSGSHLRGDESEVEQMFLATIPVKLPVAANIGSFLQVVSQIWLPRPSFWHIAILSAIVWTWARFDVQARVNL